MLLKVSARAARDIDAIVVYGEEKFGAPVARSYYKDLLDLFELILANPYMARERPELRFKSRMIRFRSHVVFYKAENGGVRILRILHGRQDWPRHL
jgi:toxin ParE1/3/4